MPGAGGACQRSGLGRDFGRPGPRITFEDNGIGIAAQHRDQIFRLFGRINSAEAFAGTGIGLAIVKKASERMGGSVGVESELGRGSRFWITLRRA